VHGVQLAVHATCRVSRELVCRLNLPSPTVTPPVQGTGQCGALLSFSLWSAVAAGIKVPSSLNNIYKELAEDVGTTKPNNGCLKKVS